MRYRFDGVDRQTGKDIRIDIEADTREDAKARALRGMVISSVKELAPAREDRPMRDMCSRCGCTIPASEGRLHNDEIVCVPCKRSLTGAVAAQRYPTQNKPSGNPHQAIGATIAIAGTLAFIVGFKMYDGLGSDNAEIAQLLARGGAVIALVGMLWFAMGRIGKPD